jgi:hypothetical protein
MVKWLSLHQHLYFDNHKSRDPTGKLVVTHLFHRPAVHQVLRLNHYWTKSSEEFMAKRVRGLASRTQSSPQTLIACLEKDLASVDDAVTDDTVIEWIIPLIKMQLAKRVRDFNETVFRKVEHCSP